MASRGAIFICAFEIGRDAVYVQRCYDESQEFELQHFRGAAQRGTGAAQTNEAATSWNVGREAAQP